MDGILTTIPDLPTSFLVLVLIRSLTSLSYNKPMLLWQSVIITIYGFISLAGFVWGLRETKGKQNAFGSAGVFNLIGAFVWGDAIVFGLFWVFVSAATLFLKDWVLFLLFVSVFWTVRSFAEIQYWISEQFAQKHRNPPEEYRLLHKIFHNDSVWFVFQIFWQCVIIIGIIVSLFLGRRWLR